MNFQINITYDGTDFSGWQIQDNVRTVQNDIQSSIREIFKNDSIKLLGSGRTDAGVHATGQVANFVIDTKMTPEQIKNAINSKIKNDIYINGCKIVKPEFNARYMATSREYIYKISKKSNPINRRYCWYVSNDIDKKKLNECARMILGTHNFILFCKALSIKEDNNCRIEKSEWNFKEEMYCYTICANRFLHHMVRILVGTMIEIGKNSMPINIFEKMLNVNINNPRIINAPAHGLYLNKVEY